ncbi:MAG: ATP synthase F1 subunit delta [Raoultibacter sp.]|jgi:F-type H+-transporting ATPase subunit delta
MPTNRLVIKEKVATYAAVLLDGLHEVGGQDAVIEGRAQLESINNYIRTSIDLTGALLDPSFSPEQHNQLVRNLLTDLNAQPVLIDVLAVMAERGDIELLPRVWTSFVEQLEEKFDVTVLDVTTSVALDDGLREIIRNKAVKDLGTNVVLREHIDGSILGGIVMSAKGQRIDASIQSQLENARNVLKQSTDGGES